MKRIARDFVLIVNEINEPIANPIPVTIVIIDDFGKEYESLTNAMEIKPSLVNARN